MGAYYDWHDDIHDANEELGGDELDQAIYTAGERIVEENGDGEYDCSHDEAVMCEASNIIGLWFIEEGSRLYKLLLDWYDGSKSKLMDEVRDSFEMGGRLFFVTGCGYAIWSKDLLGGSSDGQAARDFDEFVDEKLADE